jgi:hypothetical protein
MRRGILHGISLVGVQLALGSVVFYSVIDAQTVETSTPKQDQASVSSESSPQSSRKSFPVHLDARPTALVTTPRAVETAGLNPDYAGKAGQHQSDEKSGGRGELVVAPFPISNPALGSGLVLVGGYLFPISKHDEISPGSMLGGGSFYTSNGSWMWGAGTKLYLKQDRFRVTAIYGQAQLHYDLYGIGNSAGNLGLSVPIHQGAKALLLESLIR